MIDIKKLLPKEIILLIEELKKELNEKENSKSIIAQIINKEREKNCCPRCGSNHFKKNGKYKGRQLYKCKKCEKKFNELTNTPFHHTRLNYKQIQTAYDCLVDKLSIRKTAEKIGVSTRTAFTLRFKLISCLKSKNNEILSGEIELDEYYLSVNLKGIKTKDMPRISKKRKKNGTGKSGISKHIVCITSGADEDDHMLFKVAGTGPVTSNMIKNTLSANIKDSTKVITDCKSSYEQIAIDNKWNLKQVKSNSYVDNEGNNLAIINSLHSELTNFLSNFRGVSTKHLQEYLDWFVFSKYQNYCVKYLDRAEDFQKNTITKNTEIKYCNVYNNYSGIDFNKLYEDYCL